MAIIIGTVWLFGPTASAAASLQLPPDIEQRIDSLVEKIIERSRIPGVAIGIVDGDAVAFLKGYGEASKGRPVTPKTPFIIGSMSKSFTAVAAMQMVQEGKLNLDAAVQTYLPWFQVRDEGAASRITVRHVLNHRSGLPRSRDVSLMSLDDSARLEDIVRGLADVRLSHAPGEFFEYCNHNYLVASLIVQVLSGIPFDQYVRERILAPLKMDHSFTSEESAIADGMAVGHTYTGTPPPVERRALYSRARLGEGYIISSAEDMTHYLLALIHGGTFGGVSILSPESVRQVTAEGVRLAPTLPFPTYAMGWCNVVIGDEVVWEHDGETPSFRSSMAILPERSRGLVILTNANEDPYDGLTSLQNSLIGLMRGETPGQDGRPTPGANVGRMTSLALLFLALSDAFVLLWRWRSVRRREGRKRYRVATGLPSLLVLASLAGIPAMTGVSIRMLWLNDPINARMIVGAGALSLATLGIVFVNQRFWLKT